jgi:hypothetical protein
LYIHLEAEHRHKYYSAEEQMHKNMRREMSQVPVEAWPTDSRLA